MGAAALKERTKDSLERFRDVGERALTAGGIHLSEGIQLWDTYRYRTHLQLHGHMSFTLVMWEAGRH